MRSSTEMVLLGSLQLRLCLYPSASLAQPWKATRCVARFSRSFDTMVGMSAYSHPTPMVVSSPLTFYTTRKPRSCSGQFYSSIQSQSFCTSPTWLTTSRPGNRYEQMSISYTVSWKVADCHYSADHFQDFGSMDMGVAHTLAR